MLVLPSSTVVLDGVCRVPPEVQTKGTKAKRSAEKRVLTLGKLSNLKGYFA